MTEEVTKNENETEDLICPITLELFHDPVRAEDGHVYERNAITRWILEHGTSPFTRQPLQINNLTRDDHLRHLAEKTRKSSVSYNAQDERVTLPPLQRVFRNTHQVAPHNFNTIRTNLQPTTYSNKNLISIILFSFIFPISLILGIVIGLGNSFTPDLDITSMYSDQLTSNSSYFNRSENSVPSLYYYETIKIIISTDGFYGFEIGSDSSLSMDGDLYINNFNDINLLTYSYKDKNDSKTLLGKWILSETYVLLVTTSFCCTQGSFSVSITGPANVNFR